MVFDSLPTIQGAMREHVQLIQDLETQVPSISTIATLLMKKLSAGNRIYWCGNGGSAADSQHLAAELVGRFKRERRALPSMALTTDTSILTALANDYSYEEVFSRQVEALFQQGDVLIGISTSGNSSNVIRAVRAAKAQGGVTVGFLGRDGGQLKKECDQVVVVPSYDTARIQEMHIMIGHILCDVLEQSCLPTQ